MRTFISTLLRNRRLVALFVLMVVLPAFAFSLLIVRAIGNDQLRVAYERIERQRQIVRDAEADLNAWLRADAGDAARTHAILRFETDGGQIRFPGFDLALPGAEAVRRRPFESAPPAGRLTHEAVVSQYYPRIQAFLRDASAGRHTGAQYFLRLRALVVRPPGRNDGYVVSVETVLDYMNRRLAELCAGQSFQATVWIPDAEKKVTPALATYGLQEFPFFEVAFADTDAASAISVRRHGFAYAMTLLVAVTVLGSVFVHRAVSHEVRLSHLRNDFVAAVSHEFRSPLSSIVALAERLVAQREMPATQVAEYHRIIERDARRLSTLVARLLEFGRIEHGRAAYSLARVDLREVVQDAVDNTRHLAAAARVRFSCPEQPLWVRADSMALSLAIQNLIDNAAKYSDPASPIDVVCAADNGSHVVEVRDHGVGIDPSEHHKVFEKFYRGRAGAERNVQGVGIGLALVKHVMDAHGAAVTLESRPGEGSRFSLRLAAAEA